VKKLVPPPVFNDKGEVRQSNQGGYEYQFYEKHEKVLQFIILEVSVPRYLDTSQIDIDLNPTFVRLTIKGKVLQLSFPCEIIVSKSQAKRSQTTGSLQLVMQKLTPSLLPYFFLKEELEAQANPAKPQPKPEISPSNPVKKPKNTAPLTETFEDDPEVPPLE
jgi:hypothetical protein